MKRTLLLWLGFALVLAACRAPETVVVTQEVVREVVVTRIVAQEDAAQTPVPTSTPYPTYTPFPTSTLPPTAAPMTATPRPTSTPTAALPIPTPTFTPAPPTPTPAPAAVRPAATPLPVPALPPTPALERLPDRDPGPPFSIQVSANRAGPNSTFKITGFVHNDGDQTYEAIALNATLIDDEGFRHGPLDVRCPCVLLAPGESCPFSIETAVRRPVSFLLHPDGRPTKRESAPVELANVSLVDDGLQSVRITGTAINRQPFKIKNPVVVGALEDGSGQMVSIGWSYILQEDIEPGQGVPFDARVERVPYVRYRLYAQAERDWQ